MSLWAIRSIWLELDEQSQEQKSDRQQLPQSIYRQDHESYSLCDHITHSATQLWSIPQTNEPRIMPEKYLSGTEMQKGSWFASINKVPREYRDFCQNAKM